MQVQISDYVASGGSDQSLVFWLWMLALMIFTFLKPLGLALYQWGVEDPALINIDVTQLNDTLKENIRAIGSVLTWSLFLILPGFFRFFQLWWVPWVTLCSPAYRAGQIDALRASRLFFKYYAKRLLLFVLVFEMILPLVLEAQIYSFWLKILLLGVLQLVFYFLVQKTWNQSQKVTQLKELWEISA